MKLFLRLVWEGVFLVSWFVLESSWWLWKIRVKYGTCFLSFPSLSLLGVKSCHLKPSLFLGLRLHLSYKSSIMEEERWGKDLKSITWPSPCSTAGSSLPKSQIKKKQRKFRKHWRQSSNQLKAWLLGLTGFGRSEDRPRYSFQLSYVLMSKEQVICRKVLREIRYLTENNWKWGDWEKVI